MKFCNLRVFLNTKLLHNSFVTFYGFSKNYVLSVFLILSARKIQFAAPPLPHIGGGIFKLICNEVQNQSSSIIAMIVSRE
jgi:hypothetical protein